VDAIAPVVSSVVSGTSGVTYNGFSITRSGNATDGDSGLAANPYIYQTSIDGSNWTTKCTNNTTSCDVTGLNPSTTYYYRICAVDSVGNQACSTNKTIITTAIPVYNYAYTGTVQSFTAPVAGRYKLEVWGSQGTSLHNGIYGTGLGGRGAYAKGEVILEAGVTLYVYVGGQTSYYEGYMNGGWNGGGGAAHWCEYSIHGEPDESFKAAGGGATDISFVNSSVTYTNYRTVRSDASLLGRIIVAGGGAGGGTADKSQIYGYAGALEGPYYISGLGATQTMPGNNGGFGYGANQFDDSFRYCPPASGGGWYGGGNVVGTRQGAETRESMGGSSSFTWSSTSAANVPSGYSVATKYYLSNVEMIAGNASMPLPGGGTEVGHSGSGYARITFLSVS
jgi:hypothetical protein